HQPGRQRAAQHGPHHRAPARGQVRVPLERGDQLGQPVGVVVRPEVLQPGDLRRQGVQVAGRGPGVRGAQWWYSPQLTSRHCPVASDCAIASSAALTSLYGPIVRWENRTTMELTNTAAPPDSSSRGVNSRVSRSAATTLASKPAPRASRLTTPSSLIGGIASALYTSASTRPKAS